MGLFGLPSCLNMQRLLFFSSLLCFNQLRGSGEKQSKGLVKNRQGSFSEKCSNMASTTKRHQLEANEAKLAAYFDEKPETAMRRKKLTNKKAAHDDALQVSAMLSTYCLSHAVCVPGCLVD